MATTELPEPPVLLLQRIVTFAPFSAAAMAEYMPASPPPITRTSEAFCITTVLMGITPLPPQIYHIPGKKTNPIPYGTGHVSRRSVKLSDVYDHSALPVAFLFQDLSRALLRPQYRKNATTMLTTAGMRKLWLMQIWPMTVEIAQERIPTQLMA